MTNREKWATEFYDDAIEYSICRRYGNESSDLGDCPGCPIGTICGEFSHKGLTKSEYMAKVTEWLDKEAEDTVFEKENALKLIDSLMLENDTLRRELIMSDAIMSIGKEQNI